MASEKKTRRTFTTEQKAAILAELSQSTKKEVADKHQIAHSVIDRWREQAGMKAKTNRPKRKRNAKRRGKTGKVPRRGGRVAATHPNPQQAAALRELATGKTCRQVSNTLGVSVPTLSLWKKRFGLPNVSNGANGAPANGAPSNGLFIGSLPEAIAVLASMGQQLKAVESALMVFQNVLSGPRGMHAQAESR